VTPSGVEVAAVSIGATVTGSVDFDQFYRDTGLRVLRFVYALTGDLGAAQDLTQEAYIRAWQHWARIAAHGDHEAWVRLVAARLVTDRWRRLAVRRRAGPVAIQQQVPPPSEDTVLLVQALRTLPPRQRQVVVLHYLCDRPVSAIAAEIEAPEGSVKVWLARARAALAAQLGSLSEAANAE
jgi:RNA polymerase sigma-70 factor (ECF subfamily)